MGLAASQARYLALTARKSDLEYQSQTINTRRMQLAYKTADIATKYTDAMNNQRIMYSTRDSEGKTTWKELDFKSLFDQGCCIIGINGSGLDPAPYTVSNTKTERVYKANGNSIGDDKVTLTAAPTPAWKAALYRKVDADGKDTTDNSKVKSWVLKTSVTEAQYNAIPSTETAYKNYFSAATETTSTIEVNESYYTNNKNASDLDALLVSGRAMIVTKGFFNFLVSKGYNYKDGLTPSQYEAALDLWESQADGVNHDNQDAIVSWQADPNERFKQRNYTEDDAAALAEYEAATAEIQAQDKSLEIEEKNIETQHKAIETEMENVKKVIQKNMEETFKIFS